jgi:hypothetical protein
MLLFGRKTICHHYSYLKKKKKRKEIKLNNLHDPPPLHIVPSVFGTLNN